MTYLNLGISVVAFSPNEPDVVYGMASGTSVNASLFWVKEGRLFESRLTGHDWAVSRSLYFTTKTQQVIWVNSSEVVLFKPKEYYPSKFFVKTNKLFTVPLAINMGSSYSVDRGMFIAGIL